MLVSYSPLGIGSTSILFVLPVLGARLFRRRFRWCKTTAATPAWPYPRVEATARPQTAVKRPPLLTTAILPRPTSTLATEEENPAKKQRMADDVHGKPAAGMECLAMFEPIDETNYVEYQAAPSGKWRPCLYGAEMIEGLRTSQYKNYMERIQKSDCKAEMKRLMESGPPVWVTDKHACPLEEGETHVCKLWFMSDNREVSAMLEGACDGEERQKLWDELKSVHAASEEADANEKEAAAAPA